MDNKDKEVAETKELVKIRHKMVHDISTRLNQFSLNTVISGFMEYTNTVSYTHLDVYKRQVLYRRRKNCLS